MRVIFPFVGDTLGGSHISALTLVDGLRQRGIEAVVGVHQRGRLTDFLDGQQIPWMMLPEIVMPRGGALQKEIPLLLKIGMSLRSFLKRWKFDVVHTNDIRMHRAWLLATKLAGCVHVWHQRNPLSGRRYGWYARLSDRIVTISDYCRSSFSGYMRETAVVVQNPVFVTADGGDVAQARAELLRGLEIEDHPLIFAWVANWIDRKRPVFFVDVAAEIVRRSGRKTYFAMFGEPRDPLRKAVERRIVEQGLVGRIRVMGVQTPIAPWIAACDGLIATAVQEGLGRGLIEAMLLGVPVVAAADGGHLEIVEDNRTGFLVPPNDVGAFASAVISMVEERDLTARMVARARDEVENRYSVDAHVDAMMNIYADALSGKARR